MDYPLRRPTNDLPRGGLPVLIGVLQGALEAAGDDGFTETTATLRVYASGGNLYALRLGDASAGTFTLTLNSQTTSGIAYNAAASAVETALEALGLGGEITVLGDNIPGWPLFITINGLQVNTFTVDGSGLTDGAASLVNGWGWGPSGPTVTVRNRNPSYYAAGGETLIVVRVDGQWRPLGVTTCRQNAVFQVTVFGKPLSGTFDFYVNNTPVEVPYNSTAAGFKTLLEAHEDIGAGNIQVTNGDFPNRTMRLEFIGELANTHIPIPHADWSDLVGGQGVGVLVSTVQRGLPYPDPWS